MKAPNSIDDSGDVRFGGPGTYRIIVLGALSEEWSDRLAGMAITVTRWGDASDRTHLTGRIQDQAELRGVLESLYELHLPILSVERVSLEPWESRRTTSDAG
jgi:hypothetical protein